MRMKRIITILAAAVLAAFAFSSCVHDEEMIFDKSASLRVKDAVDNAQKTLIAAQNGWKMYYYPHPDLDYGGYMFTLKFTEDEVEAWADIFKESSKSLYKMSYDDGPVLSFDTYNPILHKYGTASSEYYEGRGGDYQFFIIGYDKDQKVIRLKGKRNGKFCTLYPLTEPQADFNARMYEYSRNFYVSSFDGFIDGQKVTGDIDVNNRQFTAYEMEIYGQDDQGQPKYDIAETKTVPYIVTAKGIHFYEPLEIFGKTFEELGFNFDMEKTDTLLTSTANNITFKGHIPQDWLPYEFFEGDWTLTYSGNTRMNLTFIPEGDKQNFRVKGFSKQFDLMMHYNIKKGRVELLAQHCRKPDTDEVIWEGKDQRYYVRLCAWENGGYLTFSTDVGMEAALKATYRPDGKIDMEASLAKPTFNWIDNRGSRSIRTNSFLLYLYDTDDSSDSPYAGEPTKTSFSGGGSQLPDLRTLVKK